MNNDVYAVCRYVKHYHTKNGYAPSMGMLQCDKEFVALLVKNEIIKLIALVEGGPTTLVYLTEKGERMANDRRTGRR